MKLLKKMRKQFAVYWPPQGVNDYGDPTWSDPVQLKVRWEDIEEVLVTARGETKESKSRVFVGQDVEEGGVLWQGTLASLTTLTEPFKNKGAGQIFAVTKAPDLKVKDFLRVAYL